MSETPPARNSAGFLRAKCRVIDGLGALRRRVRLRSSASASVRRKLNRRLAGRDRFTAWEDKKMRMAPYQVPANAWTLWGLPRQIKQRLAHMGKLPKRHAKVPIIMWARDGIGRMHAHARFMNYVRAADEREARCNAILSRLAARQSAANTEEISHEAR